MAGGRPSGGSQDWDPGPPWRFFLLLIMVALSRAAQRPLDPLVSSSFFATTSMLLLSGGPHMIGGGGHSILGTLSCAASFLSLCDSLGLGFATPEISPFVCGSAPHTPEDGRPTPPCGSRVLYDITSLSPFGPESATSATSTSPLHAKDPQPDFVDAIPISVYVSAGKVPIEAPGSVVFKDLAHLGISKHGARYAPAPPLGQGAPPHTGR